MNLEFDAKGFTLIELLATLVLFSIFGIIIWSFFFQSLKFNDVETSKNQLQQEANLIVNTIQEVHISSDSYTISMDNSQTFLKIANSNTNVTFDNKNIQYDISGSEIRSNGDYYLDLTLISTQNSSIKFETETTFSKLK